jgi:hypothetical protein
MTTQEDTKELIRRLVEDYVRLHLPEEQPHLEETWRAFDERGLFEHANVITFAESGVAGEMGATDWLDQVLLPVILAVATNLVHTVRKWSAKRLIKAMDNERWSERFLRRLAPPSAVGRAEAYRALTWMLAQLQADAKDR